MRRVWEPVAPRRLYLYPPYPRPPKTDPFSRKLIAGALRVWRNSVRATLARRDREGPPARLSPLETLCRQMLDRE